MGSEVLKAVADTGPLIHLAEIDCLPLLSIFSEVHVPDAVWREARTPATIRAHLSKRAIRHALDAADVQDFVSRYQLERLQAGECASLCLCRKLELSLVLTDDLAVREAAFRLGLTPVGSLGVIARAFLVGRLEREEAEARLEDLYSVSSLFVTRAIVDLAVERLREESA